MLYQVSALEEEVGQKRRRTSDLIQEPLLLKEVEKEVEQELSKEWVQSSRALMHVKLQVFVAAEADQVQW